MQHPVRGTNAKLVSLFLIKSDVSLIPTIIGKNCVMHMYTYTFFQGQDL